MIGRLPSLLRQRVALWGSAPLKDRMQDSTVVMVMAIGLTADDTHLTTAIATPRTGVGPHGPGTNPATSIDFLPGHRLRSILETDGMLGNETGRPGTVEEAAAEAIDPMSTLTFLAIAAADVMIARPGKTGLLAMIDLREMIVGGGRNETIGGMNGIAARETTTTVVAQVRREVEAALRSGTGSGSYTAGKHMARAAQGCNVKLEEGGLGGSRCAPCSRLRKSRLDVRVYRSRSKSMENPTAAALLRLTSCYISSHIPWKRTYVCIMATMARCFISTLPPYPPFFFLL